MDTIGRFLEPTLITGIVAMTLLFLVAWFFTWTRPAPEHRPR